jgi:amino acid transporter
LVTIGRLIYAMARDRRLPCYHFLSRVPRSTGGPSWATVRAPVLGAIIVIDVAVTPSRSPKARS